MDASHLIPLKARAWLDLVSRESNGADIDKKDIRKHKNDIFRLFQLLAPADRIATTPSIKHDMHQLFGDLDPRALREKSRNAFFVFKDRKFSNFQMASLNPILYSWADFDVCSYAGEVSFIDPVAR